jgi:hypothetical protein
MLMKRYLSLALMASAFALAPAANAADFFPGSPQFQVSGNPFTGTDTVSAHIGNEGLDGTDFDRYIFMIGPPGSDPIGLGAGSVSTIFSGVAGVDTDLDFGEISFWNGFTTFTTTAVHIGNQEVAGLSDIPIFSGVQNILTINYTARGEGSYGGDLNFTPFAAPIPEPLTWTLMLVGFAAVGLAMRRRKQDVRVRYAN